MNKFIRALVVGLAIASIFTSTSFAATSTVHTVRGSEANGGYVREFLARIDSFVSDGTVVRLRGSCGSSCTLYTHLLKYNQLCATPNTKMVFHAFHYMEGDEIKLVDAETDRQIWSVYPPVVVGILNDVFGGQLPPPGEEEIAIMADVFGIPHC